MRRSYGGAEELPGHARGRIFRCGSSPLFDSFSLLYGLTLPKPFTILAFACGSFVVVTVSGAIFDWLYPDTEVELAEPPAPPHGIKRILAILVEMARETVGPTAGRGRCWPSWGSWES